MNAFSDFEQIGRGSFGVVYRCMRVDDGVKVPCIADCIGSPTTFPPAQVVLKQAASESLDNDERQQAENEVRVLSKLNHRHIVRYDEHLGAVSELSPDMAGTMHHSFMRIGCASLLNGYAIPL